MTGFDRFRAAQAGARHAAVVTLLWSAALMLLGAVFVGASVYTGLDPQRALAGCALIYVGKIL